jgi:hypothetical protein
MAAVDDLYKEKKHKGHDSYLGHYPWTLVPQFYVQLIDSDLKALPVPVAIEPMLVDKLNTKKLPVKKRIMTDAWCDAVTQHTTTCVVYKSLI